MVCMCGKKKGKEENVCDWMTMGKRMAWGQKGQKVSAAEDGIRTRASEEIGALIRRLRPTRPPPLAPQVADPVG